MHVRYNSTNKTNKDEFESCKATSDILNAELELSRKASLDFSISQILTLLFFVFSYYFSLINFSKFKFTILNFCVKL